MPGRMRVVRHWSAANGLIIVFNQMSVLLLSQNSEGESTCVVRKSLMIDARRNGELVHHMSNLYMLHL